MTYMVMFTYESQFQNFLLQNNLKMETYKYIVYTRDIEL